MVSSSSPPFLLESPSFFPDDSTNKIMMAIMIIMARLTAPQRIIWLRSFFFRSVSNPAKFDSISPLIGAIGSPSSIY